MVNVNKTVQEYFLSACVPLAPVRLRQGTRLHHHLHEPKELPAPYPLSQRLERAATPEPRNTTAFPQNIIRPHTQQATRDRIGVGELAMMDNSGPKMGTADGAAGIPYYEKQRQHLKELLNKKKLLEKRLVGIAVATNEPSVDSPADTTTK